jgi:hypothetical protein
VASRGAANMAALSRRLEKVPDAAVADLVRWFVPRSEKVGGRIVMFGRRFQLSSKVKRRRRNQSTNTEVIGGTPAAAWSIKSYGRTGGYPVRPRGKAALKLSSFAPGVYFEHVTVKRGTAGDRRWDRLVAEADRKFPDVVAEHINRKVVI